MEDKIYFEDYVLQEEFLTPARTITEADVVMYSMITGDWNPLHSDRVYAAKRGFGGRIPVPRMLTYSVGLCLLNRVGSYVNMPKELIAFYGFTEIRFMNHLYVGDTIHGRSVVSDLTERDEGRGFVEYLQQTIKDSGEVVQESQHRILARRRPEEAVV